MKFYICLTAKRKNAKRLIQSKFASYEEALSYFDRISQNSRYHWELISGDWKEILKATYPLEKEGK